MILAGEKETRMNQKGLRPRNIPVLSFREQKGKGMHLWGVLERIPSRSLSSFTVILREPNAQVNGAPEMTWTSIPVEVLGTKISTFHISWQNLRHLSVQLQEDELGWSSVTFFSLHLYKWRLALSNGHLLSIRLNLQLSSSPIWHPLSCGLASQLLAETSW